MPARRALAAASSPAAHPPPAARRPPAAAQVSRYGPPKLGAHRAKFLMESVADLKAGLQGLGSDLLVAVGQPEQVIAGGRPAGR
jgi:deoxyribodipyrimidine photo-lyase